MLWEIIFEMLGAMATSLGEIFGAFFALLKPLFRADKDASEDEKKQHRQKVLIICIVLVVAGSAFMLPGVRHFVFQGGSQKILERQMAVHGPPVAQLPRNPLPFAQYTSPALYTKKKTIIEDDDGLKRIVYYYFFAPKPVPGQPPQKLPIVVVLHDKEGMDWGALYLRMSAVQRVYPSYLLIPQAPAENIWDAPAAWSGDEHLNLDPNAPPAPGEDGRSIRDIIPLLATATKYNPVDENRMYIVGCDIGADGVYGALARYPGLFAGGVAIGGRWSYLDRKKLAKTPLLILQGSQDQLIPSSYGMMFSQIISASGGDAAYHEFPNLGHVCDASSFYSMAVWKWLFSQSRAAATPEAAAPTALPVTAVPASAATAAAAAPGPSSAAPAPPLPPPVAAAVPTH